MCTRPPLRAAAGQRRRLMQKGTAILLELLELALCLESQLGAKVDKEASRDAVEPHTDPGTPA